LKWQPRYGEHTGPEFGEKNEKRINGEQPVLKKDECYRGYLDQR